MANFVVNSACNGRKPRQLMGSTPFYRDDLLARMMHDRSRVRYLLAPDGFGKTMLAGSYAQLMHDYQGVFWISGKNPCFLRDLDASTLLPELLEHVEEGGLVVLDDLPAMSRERCRKVWSLCHGLLDKGCEVVACATPAANPLQAYAKSCLTIRPRLFLYSDRDLEKLHAMDAGARRSHLAPTSIDRVPAVAGRAAGACEKFLLAHIDDMEDPAALALTFALVVLERGNIDDVSEVLDRNVTVQDVSADYLRPFVSLDEFRGEFDASGFPLSEIARPFAPHVHRIAAALGFENANVLVMRLARELVRFHKADRAVQLLVALSVPAVRAVWLREVQDGLAGAGVLVAPESLYESLRGTRQSKEWSLVAGSGMRRCLLGDANQAIDDLLRVVHAPAAPWEWRLKAVAMVMLMGEEDAVAKLPCTLGKAAAAAASDPEGVSDVAAEIARLLECDLLTPAAECRVADDAPAGSSASEEPPMETAPSANAFIATTPLAIACQLRARALGLGPRTNVAALSKAAEAAFGHCRDLAPDSVDFLLLRREVLRAPRGFRKPAKAMRAAQAAIDALETRIEVQEAVYRQMVRMRAAEAAASRSAVFVNEINGALPYTPPLYVTLFGQFGVQMGELDVDVSSFARGKVRVLLAMLALESGRDLSCERLCERLWPESDSPERSRHNFYSVLSLLRKALTLPGGDCPYLKKTTGAISLVPEISSSDAVEIEMLCRKLRFDEPDPDAFLRYMEQVQMLYKGELLPGMDDEPLIVSSRRIWKDKVVGALVGGSIRLMEAGDGHAALQLACYALDIDPSREDCYELVMRLQADCGQRPAAIETWVDYCRYIDTRLGLAPTPRMRSLYDRIIGAKPSNAPAT